MSDIELLVRIPASVSSPAGDKLSEEHPDWTRGEVAAESLRRQLGAWVEVTILKDPST